MKAVHFACDLTSLLRHRNPEKKKTSTSILFVIWPPIWLFIMSPTKSIISAVNYMSEIVPTVTQGF